jgi:N-acetylmuramoyl-L-alanine amidase
VGVSLFLDSLPDNVIVAPDDVTEPAGPLDVDTDDAAPVATQGTIVIDPGHGGAAQVGSSSPNNARGPVSGTLEKELTLAMAKLVRDSLADRAPGVRIELTRNTDTNLDLSERAKVARELKADLFLSIHFNGSEGHNARGVETLIRPKAAGNVNHEEDRRFAERIQTAVHGAIKALDDGTKNRGVKDQVLGVLRDDFLGNSIANHPCRACLCEIEFLDVPTVDKLFNVGPQADAVRSRVADAIAGALLEELGA